MDKKRLEAIVEKMKMAGGQPRYCKHCGQELCAVMPVFSREDVAEVEGLIGTVVRPILQGEAELPDIRRAMENPEEYARRLIAMRRRQKYM